MIKPSDPRILAVDLIPRSICLVQVAAVLCDSSGRIVAWGWNHMGRSGHGMCAERHAFSRANGSRLAYGTVYVAGKYKNKAYVKAKPCGLCQSVIDSFRMNVYWRDKNGKWIEE